MPATAALCVAAPSPSAQPVALTPVLPLLTVLCVVVRLAPVDAALATVLCVAAPSPSAQPVALAPVLATALCVAVPSPSAQPVALAPVFPLLTALRVVVRLAPVDAALAVLGSGG